MVDVTAEKGGITSMTRVTHGSKSDKGILTLVLLKRTRIFKSKDPRDHIFALISLASSLDPEFRSRLIDYIKIFLDVQIKLASWLILNQRNTGSLLFSYAGLY